MPAPICSRSVPFFTRWRQAHCRGESSAMICEAIVNRAPVAPVRLNHDLPVELERIINKALEKDRDLRYQGAAELRADLKRLKRETETPKPRPCPRQWPPVRSPCQQPARLAAVRRSTTDNPAGAGAKAG